jgi:N4-(beta-N-acetylglucosaminyl)-L-asparaginase
MGMKVGRRGFLKQFLGAAAATPFLTGAPFVTRDLLRRKSRLPVIVTSRGKRGNWAEKVLTAAWKAYEKTGDMMEAVIAGANVVELDPEDMSVGYGGIPNEEGVVQLDSSVMHGPKRNAGAVAALEYIKTPSRVALLVMDRTDHVMLVGEGALRFALAHGFKKENLLTDKAREIWLRWKENLSPNDDWFPPPPDDDGLGGPPHGTINVLGVDEEGNVFGVTTTSGLGFKIPGRVGDSPIIGAGLYVANDVGAAGATGRGEEVIKICGSFLVVENMRRGMSPKQAVEDACKRLIKLHNGDPRFSDNFIAVNREGEVYRGGVRGLKKYGGPEYAAIRNGNLEIYRGEYLIKDEKPIW